MPEQEERKVYPSLPHATTILFPNEGLTKGKEGRLSNEGWGELGQDEGDNEDGDETKRGQRVDERKGEEG